jgi:hypothetical protein
MADVYGKIAAWADNAQADTTGNDAINNLAAALNESTLASNDLQGVLGLISGPGYKSATRNLLSQLASKDTVTQKDLTDLAAKATIDAKKCNQNTGSKGQRPYSDAIQKNVEAVGGSSYLQDGGSARHSEFAVLLDHAAPGFAGPQWIKRAEAEVVALRRYPRLANSLVREGLVGFVLLERSGTSGAFEPYRIRRRAVDG